MKNIVVVGAGIAGITAAYYLAKEGHTVTVIEQERYPAMRTSYANGGQISVSNSETWTTWSNIIKGIKWITRKDAPLLIRPTFEFAKLKWIWSFLIETISNNYARNTVETIKLGLEARSLYSEIIQEEQIQFDFKPTGILHFYKNKDYYAHAYLVREMYYGNGCDWDVLTDKETKKKEPALNDVSGILGGAWTKSDSVGDIHKFCIELQKVLETKYNVKFIFDKKVLSIHELEDYNKIIIANGVGSVALAKSIGESISVYPVKGYSITIPAKTIESYNAMPKVSLLDDEAKIVCSLLGDRLRVAGTAELTGENYDIRRDRIEPLLRWVHENFPKVDTSEYSSWACLRPMTPSMMPIVRASSKNSKVYYHTGHGHLGWTLAPATAKQLVGLIKT